MNFGKSAFNNILGTPQDPLDRNSVPERTKIWT